MKVGISSCLLGNKVRYDGTHKLDRYLRDVLGQYVEWVPVCPEVECGMEVPRETMRLVGDPESPRLVTVRTKRDLTRQMTTWAQARVRQLEQEDLCGFVFKTRSPSSGLSGVKVYTEEGMPSRTGSGLFAREFVRHFPLVPVEDEGRLSDPDLRENFIERLFVLARWKELLRGDNSPKGLIEFHSDHKYLLMAHSPKHLKELGKLVANVKHRGLELTQTAYLSAMLGGLRLIATVRKNVNVLQHIAGYFRGVLTDDDRRELREVIGEYEREFVPLVVPIVLLRHFVRKYDMTCLKRQHYLHPHPAELRLRNHV